MSGSGKIMYCAFPTRLRHLRETIRIRARAMGYAPVIPFDCGDFEDFEGNPRIGRAKTLQFMLSIMRGCDVVGVFGISAGVMGEIKTALDFHMEVHVYHGLDPEWDRYYNLLKAEYGDQLQRLRGEHYLIALVGPSAVGKTYWANRLIERYAGRLRRVKNTTTRPPRNLADHDSYNFVSRQAFERGIVNSQFLEYDQYLDQYYGSSLADIHYVLRTHSGIFAITPAGAMALYDCRFEINLVNILLQPATTEVLRRNLRRRGIIDPDRCAEMIAAAEQFTLPSHISHQVVPITGRTRTDEKKIIKIVDQFIHPQ